MSPGTARSSRDQVVELVAAADTVDNGTYHQRSQTAACKIARSTYGIGESPCTAETDSSRYCMTRDPESRRAQGAAGSDTRSDGPRRQVTRGFGGQGCGVPPEATAISSRCSAGKSTRLSEMEGTGCRCRWTSPKIQSAKNYSRTMCLLDTPVVDANQAVCHLIATIAERNEGYTTPGQRDLECGPGISKGAPVSRYWSTRALNDLCDKLL